jgi:hypothetical protein
LDDSEFSCYYKTQKVGETTDMDKMPWIPAGPDVTPTRDGQYRDYTYTINHLKPFVATQVKIVMLGLNTASAPRIKDFRIVALDE